MFLDLTAFARVDYCRRVRERVRQITKIPTCVGIGPTKTLAKLANKHAKTATGVSDFSDIDIRREAFAFTPSLQEKLMGRARPVIRVRVRQPPPARLRWKGWRAAASTASRSGRATTA